jgi:hypothetical protein
MTMLARQEQIYAGLAVPRVTPSFKVSGGDLVGFLKDRLREQGSPDETLYTVYLPAPKALKAGPETRPRDYTVLVCRPYPDVASVPLGHLMIRIPAGLYVRFEPNGHYADPIEDVWAQVDDATAGGAIARSYLEEIEISSTAGVELQISVGL